MIKLVAVDMDGTFLDDQKHYDKDRFAKIFGEMQKKQAEFVVASGNQYVQLVQFFEPIKEKITFISDNGAMVTKHGEEIFSSSFEKTDVKKILEVLSFKTNFRVVVCGKKGAYILDTVPDDFIKTIEFYCPVMFKVENYDQIDDEVLKIALSCSEEETEYLLEELHGEISHIAIPVSSGHGSIDLIQPNMHKGNAIQFVLDYFDFTQEEAAAFGDGGNDVEMLKLVGTSFAMSNAPDAVKQVAKHVAPSNNEAGVLAQMEKIFF
ncbi:Cof-type HAD-IIB family hydrolase [Listeria aquatica]|uniref:HAD family hydrolase n=2 Tax=Listeria aquatica TaxID=1494960 RepID=A0A841ZRN9_9LIST|nr:Cof-type HAD-IIB family hydrolase [Listeria aquatica]MBC1521281.1 HAD family hydrolase [Listeria aquatica]